MMSRAMIASALMLGTAAGAANAAPTPGGREAPPVVAPVYYRCVVPVCGPYRCVWVNRCRRPWWW
jgi:hypothetical protein